MQTIAPSALRISTDAELTPRRQRRRHKRRQEILAVAMDLLLSGNRDEFSINGLARALDCSPATLYVYFPSREALLSELQALTLKDAGKFYTQFANLATAYAQAQPVNSQAKLAFRLQAIAWVFYRFSEAYPVHFRFLNQVLTDYGPSDKTNSAAIPVAVSAGESVLGLIAQLLNEAVEQRLLAPGNAYERAIILWSGLQGLLQLKKVAGFYPNILRIQALMDEQTLTLLKGWGASDKNLAIVQTMKKGWKP